MKGLDPTTLFLTSNDRSELYMNILSIIIAILNVCKI